MRQLHKFTVLFILVAASWLCGQDKSNVWKTFVDEHVGYSVEYPSNWKAEGRKGGFICGKESGFKNADWVIWLSDADNTERIEFLFEYKDLYKGYEIIESPIKINGLDALHILITHKEKQDEYVEMVHLKTEKTWFCFQNNGVKDSKFEYFYNSFKLLK